MIDKSIYLKLAESLYTDELIAKASKVELLAFDVDGVLTDGKIILHPSGEQLRTMNVKDGMAIRTALSKGYKIAIISGGKSKGLIERFKHLKIDDVYLGCDDKKDGSSL